MNELLPCPFCGGEAHWQYSAGTENGVFCMKCRAHVNYHNGAFMEAVQISALWNTRTKLDKLTKAVELLESCQRNVHMSRFEWDEIENFLQEIQQ